MNSVDLNNADAIKEKTNSLNAQKIMNRNNLVQNQISEHKDKKFCNDELKKHVSILFITLFLLTFIGSVVAFCCITFTNRFNENIVEKLVLKNNTKAMDWWKDLPIQPLLKIYIYNYTNIDDYLSGRDDKIKVQDVGPYVYKEFGQRVKLEFHEGNKITFYDNKTLIYMPDLSNGRKEDDIVNVPNIPLLAALTKAEDLNRLMIMAFDMILTTTKPKEFHAKTVNEYLFGYTDSFISATPDIDPSRVGLLAGRRGVSVDNLTVYTGEDSLNNLGKIHAMNGDLRLKIWENESVCNEIIGTDGSQFPPHLIDKDEELQIFIKSFCRTIKLKFEREVTVLNGIPAWRYKSPEGGFGSSLTNPDNKCYCDSEIEKCPPDGVFDASKCVDGIPLMVSYPHFLEGDESLFTNFEGLKPNRKKHGTFADIHPRMAFPIDGASRLQMNFRVKEKNISSFFTKYSWYSKFPKDLILPLFWFEVTSGEIPPEFLTVVFHTTQSANATYLAIQYGSIVGAFVSLLLLLSTSYIYFNKLTGKPSEKIQNKDVIVTFKPNIYPNTSSQLDHNTVNEQ